MRTYQRKFCPWPNHLLKVSSFLNTTLPGTETLLKPYTDHSWLTKSIGTCIVVVTQLHIFSEHSKFFCRAYPYKHFTKQNMKNVYLEKATSYRYWAITVFLTLAILMTTNTAGVEASLSKKVNWSVIVVDLGRRRGGSEILGNIENSRPVWAACILSKPCSTSPHHRHWKDNEKTRIYLIPYFLAMSRYIHFTIQILFLNIVYEIEMKGDLARILTKILLQ